MKRQLLVAGIGNIFFGDDGFGVEVAWELLKRRWPEHIRVVDFGIRGLDLTYALLSGDYEQVILIDAVDRGGVPGTIYLIEPSGCSGDEAEGADGEDLSAGPGMIDPHDLNPDKVLGAVAAMGGRLERVVLIGCQPRAARSAEALAAGLSPAVRGAIPKTIEMLDSILDDIHVAGVRI